MTDDLRRAAARRILQIHEARQNFTQFVRTVGMNAEGDPLDIAPMHLAWHAHVDYCWSRGLYAGILAHFGSGKSSSFAVPLLAWWLGQNPNRRTTIVCNDDRSAARRVGLVSKLITDVPTYRTIFPGIVPGEKWTDHELFVRRTGMSADPSVLGRGVLTTGIGTHCNVMVFDDVVDQRNSEDTEQRKRILNLIQQTWIGRIDPGGHALYIATPWNLDDATHHLMQTPGWCFLVQRVNQTCTAIEQEVFGGGDDYPTFLP